MPVIMVRCPYSPRKEGKSEQVSFLAEVKLEKGKLML